MIEIRPPTEEELYTVLYKMRGYAFRPSPPLQDPDEWQSLFSAVKNALYKTGFENDQPVTHAGCFRLNQTVRGKLFKAGGIWSVISIPQVRRKGYVRQLLQSLFETMREEGMMVSCLYPFRESYYERMGYVTFPQVYKISFATSALQPLLKHDLSGKVELLELEDNVDLVYGYLKQAHLIRHGFAVFDDQNWLTRFGRKDLWLAVARDDEGEVIGLMLYKLSGFEGRFTVTKFFYSNSQAKYLLLEFIARHIDQVNDVLLHLPAYERPETWLSDLKLNIEGVLPPMGRVMDVQGIAGLETGIGSFTARIDDPMCEWNNGVFAFETVDDNLQVAPATTADCELSIQALSALVYGTHTPEDFAFRGWGDPSPALQETMNHMFPRKLPYLNEVY